MADDSTKQQLKAATRREEAQRLEISRLKRSSRTTLVVAVLGPLVAGIFGLGGNIIDHQPPATTTDTVSVCTVAMGNVKKALDLGIARPALLEKINIEEIDSQCGEEIEIAADIQDGQ